MDDVTTMLPWVLVGALALPALALLTLREPPSRRTLRWLLVPAVVMAVVTAATTLDQRRVDQEELDAAVEVATSAYAGSYGPVNAEDVRRVVSEELGRDVVVRQVGGLDVVDEQNTRWRLEVRPDEEADEGAAGPATCVEVALTLMAQDAPDARFVEMRSRSGRC